MHPENDPDGELPPASPPTDVWSFGMLCLEIMTGQRPYAHRKKDTDVVQELIKYRLPPRPQGEEVLSRGLTDDLWLLMLSCWHLNPERRPTMGHIRIQMLRLSESPLVLPGTFAVQLHCSSLPLTCFAGS